MTPLLTSAEAVAAEILARIGAVSVANGYETNLGAKVFAGRRSVDPSMLPCATLIEADDEIQDLTNMRIGVPQAEIKQHYVMYAYLECDPDHPNTMAHKAIRDFKRAVFNTDGKPDASFGRKVREVRYLGRDISPRADGSATVVAAIEITVQFVESLSAP